MKARGLRRLVACALRENHAFVHLARRAGFRVDEVDGATQHWVLPLTADEADHGDVSAAFAPSNGIQLCYETFGDRANPPLVLIMGLATQMIVWDDEFCALLAARGFWVVRFDNRDIGMSTRFRKRARRASRSSMLAQATRIKFRVPYTLRDMAADTVGLMDALGIRSAHVVGASMGGMIAQELAILYPARVRSLTSIMSSTGDPRLPRATPRALAVLGKKVPLDREGYVREYVATWRVLPGEHFPFNAERTARQGARLVRPRHQPAGRRAPDCSPSSRPAAEKRHCAASKLRRW